MKLVKYILLLFSDRLGVNKYEKTTLKTKKSTIQLKKGLAPKSLKEGDLIYDASNNVLGKYSSKKSNL